MVTTDTDLDSQYAQYDSTTSSFLSLNVQFIIAPDTTNDDPAPKYYAN